MHVFSEMGIGHPQGCMQDGIMSATGATFNKVKCEACGEYVFERYLRVKDEKKVCIPCSGRTVEEKVIHLPNILMS